MAFGAVAEAFRKRLALLLVVGVELFFAAGDAEQRRLRDIDVARVDQLLHFLVEEREEQRADMGAVHVGVCHDDDLVVARFGDFEVLGHARADRRDDRTDFFVGQDLVDARLLHVENLAAQRQDRLEAAVAALLGGAAGRVALDEIDLAERGIGKRAVGELPGQQARLEPAALAHQLARLARGFARARGADRFRDDGAGHARILVEEVAQRFVHHALDDPLDLGVAELGLGLPLELRLLHLHVQHRVQALAHVVAGERELFLLEEAVLLRPFVDRARERGLEAGEVCAAFVGVDVVHEGERILAVLIVVLHGTLDLHVFARGLEGDRLGMQRAAAAQHPLHEFRETALVVVRLRLSLARALVFERDGEGLVQEGELAQPVGERVEVEARLGEDRRACRV